MIDVVSGPLGVAFLIIGIVAELEVDLVEFVTDEFAFFFRELLVYSFGASEGVDFAGLEVFEANWFGFAVVIMLADTLIMDATS